MVDPIVLVGCGIVVVAALLGALVLSMKRGEKEPVVPTRDELGAAKEAVLAAPTLDALAAETAVQIEQVVGADGGMVTLDGVEARSGAALKISSETAVDLTKKRVVRQDDILAIPIRFDGRVVGYIAAKGGHDESLHELARDVTESFASRQPKSSRLHRKVAESNLDTLTGVGNRRRFNNDLAAVSTDETDDAIPVSLAMFDIDDFRYYNEAHGKQAGNDVLRSVAALIAGNLRGSDVVYRYSGVKFVALLPGATVENGYAVVERIRRAVESTRFDGEEVQPTGRVTMSIGIAEAPADQADTLIDAADAALAVAKDSGRNKVVIEADIA